MTFSSQDAQFMRQALELARKGTSLTSPGARVGAVIVDAQCNAAGSGFYTFDGIKHAEVLALEQAGARARGGTIYLNLEPHCHQGRTPPCTDALVAAGIKRVIAAMADPNPLVAGKGFDQLRAAGVEVKTGLLEAEARRLNEAFAKYILTNRPLITLKSGMTLDGKIAPPPSEPSSEPSGEASSSKASSGKPDDPSVPTSAGLTGGWITSAEARAHVHELRHESDAIMVGVGTVLADDPLLTDRTGRPRRRPLLRVIIDSRLRLPVDSRIVNTAKDDVIVFCALADEKRRRELELRGIRVEQLPLYHFEDVNVVGARPIK